MSVRTGLLSTKNCVTDCGNRERKREASLFTK